MVDTRLSTTVLGQRRATAAPCLIPVIADKADVSRDGTSPSLSPSRQFEVSDLTVEVGLNGVRGIIIGCNHCDLTMY